MYLQKIRLLGVGLFSAVALSACGTPLQGHLTVVNPEQPLVIRQDDGSRVELQEGDYSLLVDVSLFGSDAEIEIRRGRKKVATMPVPNRGKEFDPQRFEFKAWEIRQGFDLAGSTTWGNQRFSERRYYESCGPYPGPGPGYADPGGPQGRREVVERWETIDETLSIEFLSTSGTTRAKQAEFRGTRTHHRIVDAQRGPCFWW